MRLHGYTFNLSRISFARKCNADRFHGTSFVLIHMRQRHREAAPGNISTISDRLSLESAARTNPLTHAIGENLKQLTGREANAVRFRRSDIQAWFGEPPIRSPWSNGHPSVINTCCVVSPSAAVLEWPLGFSWKLILHLCVSGIKEPCSLRNAKNVNWQIIKRKSSKPGGEEKK